MKQKFAKLIDVKSIVTITGWFAFIAFVGWGIVQGTSFEEVMKMIIVFYFGTQAAKKHEE